MKRILSAPAVYHNVKIRVHKRPVSWILKINGARPYFPKRVPSLTGLNGNRNRYIDATLQRGSGLLLAELTFIKVYINEREVLANVSGNSLP